MGYRTILIHCGADEDAAALVRTAAFVGAPFDATLVGVGAIAWDPCLDPAIIAASGDTLQTLRQHYDHQRGEAEAAFRSACKEISRPCLWRSVSEYPADAMVRLAGGADLIVAGHGPRNGDDRARPFPGDLVMRAGAPVLLVSAEQEPCMPSRILIGWKNTRECRRAVSDALPLLKMAAKVTVVHVCAGGPTPEIDAELRDVGDRLLRHGVEAACTTYPRLGSQADEDLMALAHAYGADTVVAGAYGHSRLREWAFGGVTRNLLDRPERRVLLSR